jgi:putative ABC transport system permease protein
MRLGNLLFLYVQRVRTHPVQELVALLGIGVGVALVFAVQVANTSVAGSVEQLTRGVTGTAALQVASRDDEGFPDSVATRIADLPGVRASAPLLDAHVNLRGRDGIRTVDLLGGDRRLAALGGALVQELGSSHLHLTDAIALPAPLAKALGASANDDVRLDTGAATLRVPVATVLGQDQIGALVNSPIALAPLAYAQRISGLRGRVTRVLVAPRPGRAREVRAGLERIAADRLNVTTGDQELRLLHQATAPNDQSTALFAAISALVGLLFAFNAMLLTVPERRRFLADLRLEGLGDRSIVRLVVFDALVLGVAASVLGLLLGELLSRNVFHSAPGYLSYAFTVGSTRIVAPRSVALAVAGGVGATLLAALRPLSDLLSRRPLDDVYREDDERDEDALIQRGWMLAAGTSFVVAATAVLLFAPSVTIAGIGLLLAGMLLLIPGILGSVLRLIDVLSHHLRSAVLVVSLGELRATTTRSIALAATGALAVFGSVAVEGAHLDLQRGLDRDAHELNAAADVWIAQSGSENALATTPFAIPPRLRLSTLPGVKSVGVYRGGFLDVGDRRLWVIAPPAADPMPIPPSQIVEGDETLATRRLRGGGWGVLSRAVARAQGLVIGDTFTLPTSNPRPLRLAAETTNLGWAPGAVILNAADYQRAWQTTDPSALQVQIAPGSDLTAVLQRVRASVAAAGGGLEVETAPQREQRFRESSRQGLNRLTQIATLVLIAAAIAMAAAMAGVVWLRRPRLAALKLSGFDDGAVWRSLLLESAIVLGVGCSVGALFGLYGQLMLTRWLRDSTGFPTSYAAAGLLAVGVLTLVTLVAVAIAAVPGYLAARTSPALSLHED